MTPPPLPPGVEGHPVCPDIHTGCPEPDRDGWADTEPVSFDEHVDIALDTIKETTP